MFAGRTTALLTVHSARLRNRWISTSVGDFVGVASGFRGFDHATRGHEDPVVVGTPGAGSMCGNPLGNRANELLDVIDTNAVAGSFSVMSRRRWGLAVGDCRP
ncbi:hypothetical protein ACT18_23100 [Mycolicibacter kumamotonensis]|uniref:Uncharacterized protein n=1 Tax=Mycolicibacter kumamotonensis TaxID=354243 RepID=A0A1B8S9S8_9MYCO|nr:hypothetical protein ACT18_23100 [Mycolicibacter kumamotonensis]